MINVYADFESHYLLTHLTVLQLHHISFFTATLATLKHQSAQYTQRKANTISHSLALIVQLQ